MKILETIDTPIGGYAPDFELPGIDGQVHHLSRYLEKFRAVGVVSMCNNCPYVGHYLERLKQIQQEFSSFGFTLIGVNGNAVVNQDLVESFDRMKAFASQYQLNFPYLWDSTQDVTRSFGAMSTPTAFLIDKEGRVRYRGQIDDNPDSEAVQVQYLRNATASLFGDNNIDITETEVMGTAIIWRN